jgi:AcrR family transcriptional regulator
MGPQDTVVWVRHATLSPRARRELRRLVDVAIDIADRDGLAALTMRVLAAEAETGTTTLYRYIRSRDELLELMADAVHEAADLPDQTSGHWRADLSAIAHAMRAQYLQHPWLPTLVVTVGPHTLRMANLAAAAALRLSPDPATAEAVTSTIYHYVRGAVLGEIAETTSTTHAPLTAAQVRSITSWKQAMLDNPDYAAFARLRRTDVTLTHAERFEFGLERLLDGIERQLDV